MPASAATERLLGTGVLVDVDVDVEVDVDDDGELVIEALEAFEVPLMGEVVLDTRVELFRALVELAVVVETMAFTEFTELSAVVELGGRVEVAPPDVGVTVGVSPGPKSIVPPVAVGNLPILVRLGLSVKTAVRAEAVQTQVLGSEVTRG